MSDPTPTRQETVEANIEDTIAVWGEENVNRLISTCLKDISISLAMLVDAGSSAE